MKDSRVKRFSQLHTLIFRSTRGAVGKRLVDNDMLLLTTTGRKSGKKHTVPLLYLTDIDAIVVIASYGGRPHHPAWYLNLVAEPEAQVQILGVKRQVTAETMDAADRSIWWPILVEAHPGYEEYGSRTDREIPIVRLS